MPCDTSPCLLSQKPIIPHAFAFDYLESLSVEDAFPWAYWDHQILFEIFHLLSSKISYICWENYLENSTWFPVTTPSPSGLWYWILFPAPRFTSYHVSSSYMFHISVCYGGFSVKVSHKHLYDDVMNKIFTFRATFLTSTTWLYLRWNLPRPDIRDVQTSLGSCVLKEFYCDIVVEATNSCTVSEEYTWSFSSYLSTEWTKLGISSLIVSVEVGEMLLIVFSEVESVIKEKIVA